MDKVAVLFKEGYEEIEALTIVDVLRRANVECVMIGMDDMKVTSNHGVTIQMDQLFDTTLIDTINMVVLPGGMPGAKNLKEDIRVITLLQQMKEQNKYIGAICAAPIVLQEAGVITNKEVICYPGFEEDLKDAIIKEKLVVVDLPVITSKGPATALLFAYTLLEVLGIESESLQEAMQYQALLHKQ